MKRLTEDLETPKELAIASIKPAWVQIEGLARQRDGCPTGRKCCVLRIDDLTMSALVIADGSYSPSWARLEHRGRPVATRGHRPFKKKALASRMNTGMIAIYLIAFN